MASRRTFLKGSALFSALAVPAVSRAMPLVDLHGVPKPYPSRIFFDEAMGVENGFVREFRSRGIPAQAVGSDPTAFWLQLQDETGPIAGLTRPNILFCLEQLSCTGSTRLQFRERHDHNIGQEASAAAAQHILSLCCGSAALPLSPAPLARSDEGLVAWLAMPAAGAK